MLGIKQHFEVSLDMTQDDFVDRLLPVVDTRSFNYPNDARKEFKGKVAFGNFQLEAIQRKFGLTVIEGSFEESNQGLLVRGEVRFQKLPSIFRLIYILIALWLFISSILTESNFMGEGSVVGLLFLLFGIAKTWYDIRKLGALKKYFLDTIQ